MLTELENNQDHRTHQHQQHGLDIAHQHSCNGSTSIDQSDPPDSRWRIRPQLGRERVQPGCACSG
jgi:hypothetical protein